VKGGRESEGVVGGRREGKSRSKVLKVSEMEWGGGGEGRDGLSRGGGRVVRGERDQGGERSVHTRGVGEEEVAKRGG